MCYVHVIPGNNVTDAYWTPFKTQNDAAYALIPISPVITKFNFQLANIDCMGV